MMRGKGIISLLMAVAALCLLSAPARAFQKNERESSLSCNDNWGDRRLVANCNIKEQTLSARSLVNVDARQNGGVSIKGWDRGDILMRARIIARALTEEEARALADQIRIDTGSQIRAEGPQARRDSYWDVSYEIFVPRQTDLTLETYNGGIGITEVRGRINFTALNGGVSLRRLGGSVNGRTTNGGINVDLTGDRWDGEGINVETTNGGVNIYIPDGYNAHLETGTVNGGLDVGIPLVLQGRITHDISVNLGNGGPTVRVSTTNGGVRIKRKE